MESIASSKPEKQQVALIARADHLDHAAVASLLSDPDLLWTSPSGRGILHQALHKVSARGDLALLRLLLDHGADPRAQPSSLAKAAEAGRAEVVRELIRRGADPNSRLGRTGQTPLFNACVRGHVAVVQALLEGGARADAKDKEMRTPLLFLASQTKPRKFKPETLKEILRLLVGHGAEVEARDAVSRTALLWAATNGDLELADVLLREDADLKAANKRGKTALHLAAESNHVDMVRLLLEAGADATIESDGGWTALHNAAQDGHLEVVRLLLAPGTNVNANAKLASGMTPLHWAAFYGHVDVVKLILTRPDADISIKDNSYRTPMLCAAEKYHKEIVQLLSPARAADRLSPSARGACEQFDATVVDFGEFRDNKKSLVHKYSVFDVLYGWDEDNSGPKVPTVTKNIKHQPAFRWIHLPANNIAWVEVLMAKHFIETGHRDLDSFKMLERCFDQEHRGPMPHAHFMRTYSQRITGPHRPTIDKDDRDRTLVPEDSSDVNTLNASLSETGILGMGRAEAGTGETASPRPDKKKGKGDQIAERHPRRAKRTNGPPGNPPGTKEAKTAVKKQIDLQREAAKLPTSNSRLVLFMPFLHFETNGRREKMSREVNRVHNKKPSTEKMSRDALLVEAYLNNRPPLHPRRTLDQFFYHGIDTSTRDTDQVVYRHCKRHRQELTIFMVDQLWLWVFGRDLVITCFPQRWDQPKQDPLNVVDGIIEEIDAKTRPPVQSVYDLSMLITSRCSGMFDRHRLEDQTFQFLDMFESSIGAVTDAESSLFSHFNEASERFARHRRPGRRTHERSRSHGDSPDDAFPDDLLNISKETSLLAEIKDIRDELNILAVILDSQTGVLDEFAQLLEDELRSVVVHPSPSTLPNASTLSLSTLQPTKSDHAANRRTIDVFVSEIRKRARDTHRRLDVSRKDLKRMDAQADQIYDGLAHLLDLKQKHSNALEARFARDQAVIAARQGQTVMVFTIVTIVFLPMSFVAAFFAINLREWDDGRLSIAYVSKFLFGIGLGISIPLIAMAFTVNEMWTSAVGFYREVHGFVGRWWGSGDSVTEKESRGEEKERFHHEE